MGGRTMPTECAHGVIVDDGDFGPCQNCDDHGNAGCPNYHDCQECEQEIDAQIQRMEEGQREKDRRIWQDGYTAGYQQGRNDERDGQPAPLEVPLP